MTATVKPVTSGKEMENSSEYTKEEREELMRGTNWSKSSKKSLSQKFYRESIKFLDSWEWGLFMAVVTIYTLFFDDLRVIFLPKSADDFFFGITSIAFVLFLSEIILSCYCKKEYFNSFFFWLDLMSTFSMIADIGWIMEPINKVLGSGYSDASSLAKTSRAARVTRIVRLVRLIRLVRIVKLYKQAK